MGWPVSLETICNECLSSAIIKLIQVDAAGNVQMTLECSNEGCLMAWEESPTDEAAALELAATWVGVELNA